MAPDKALLSAKIGFLHIREKSGNFLFQDQEIVMEF